MKHTWLLVLLTACGSKAPAATTTTTPTTGSGSGSDHAEVTLPDVPFDQLNDDQRAEFMKQKVVPAMKPIFQQHDAKKYAEFGCETCHGPGVATGHFDMPNDKLPLLVVKEMTTGKYKKEDLEWMAHQVKPTMAKLLKQEEWTPQTPKGFACGACHPMKMD
jgi:hypothetical protein